jgi:hypothetical protein
MLFKISMVTRKNYVGPYRKFGHAPSKSFTSRGLVGIPTELFRLQTTIIGFQKNMSSRDAFCMKKWPVVFCEIWISHDFASGVSNLF